MVQVTGSRMLVRANGPDHHVLTLTENDGAGLHHVALQIPNLDDIDRAYEDLLARGVEIVTPPTLRSTTLC